MPPLYDLAFGYRNYEEEVDFLLQMHSKHSSTNSGGSGMRLLELAAGPAPFVPASLRSRFGFVSPLLN